MAAAALASSVGTAAAAGPSETSLLKPLLSFGGTARGSRERGGGRGARRRRASRRRAGALATASPPQLLLPLVVARALERVLAASRHGIGKLQAEERTGTSRGASAAHAIRFRYTGLSLFEHATTEILEALWQRFSLSLSFFLLRPSTQLAGDLAPSGALSLLSFSLFSPPPCLRHDL